MTNNESFPAREWSAGVRINVRPFKPRKAGVQYCAFEGFSDLVAPKPSPL